jgi:hypothetical protein
LHPCSWKLNEFSTTLSTVDGLGNYAKFLVSCFRYTFYVLEMDVKVVMSVADWADMQNLEWSHRDISWWKRLEHKD